MKFVAQTTSESELLALAKCHRAAFPNSLASALGRRYCAQMLSWYLSSNKTFLFHIEDDSGKCAGYCGGMISDGTLGTGSASGMAQYSFYPALWAFITHPWVIFHAEVRNKWPLLRKNLAMRLGLRKKVHFNQEQKKQLAKDPQAGLVVIGVDPAYQGKGCGSILLKEFERRSLEDYGMKKLQLTVRTDNTQAILAYERNGWLKTSSDLVSTTMEKSLTK
jgi:ribosomal protein S18 acetylase RimI-like enzyme